jgi:nitroreductase
MGPFSTTIRERRSIRRYLPQPVPDTLIQEVLSDACWAPSWGNTQSTSVYVLSGDALTRLRAGLLERALKEAPGEPDLEMPAPGSWPEPYRSRTGGFVQSRTAFVAEEESKRGITPADPPVPPPVAGAALFGAPHLLLVGTTAGLSVPYSCFDAGAFTQTIALAAQERGLGTCIMAGVVRHPDLFRSLIPESDDLVFMAAMTLGYPDPDAPINHFPRQRADLGERAFFVGS